ncbi:hypothetical protein GGF32_008539, partial [Allomyces javanicus]
MSDLLSRRTTPAYDLVDDDDAPHSRGSSVTDGESLLLKAPRPGRSPLLAPRPLRKLLYSATGPHRRRAVLAAVAIAALVLLGLVLRSSPSDPSTLATTTHDLEQGGATSTFLAATDVDAAAAASVVDGAAPVAAATPAVDPHLEWFPPVRGDAEPLPDHDRKATVVANTDVFQHYRSRIDPDVAFWDDQSPNIEPHGSGRKLGLVVVPAGQSSKRRVDELVQQFGLDHFAFLLCLWDHSTWTEFDWYPNVTTVRGRGQNKFWFVKRFVPPEVALAYDYIWLLDDDVTIDLDWDPVDATKAMKKYNVHFAQSALTMGEHFAQGQIERRVPLYKVGHWANFIEMMAPIISRGAYACAWTLIPWDARSAWGIDNMLYPVCSTVGYCRFAILDAYPMKHLDTKTFTGSTSRNMREAGATGDLINWFCAHVESGLISSAPWAASMRTALCGRLGRRDVFHDYRTFGEMRPTHAVRTDKCFEEPGEMGEMAGVPWWYPRMV